MTRKTYDMHCAVARSLEVLGERWTLLVVRELLTGPKRYADLQVGLPGIATNMLSDRLRSLQDAAVITQEVLPPPAASTVYRLTSRGMDLKPVLLALGIWGLPLLGNPRHGEQFRLAWLMIALDGIYDPDAAPETLTISLNVGPEALTVTAYGRHHTVTEGPPEHADLSIHADRNTFLAWATGQIDDQAAVTAGLTVTPAGDGLPRLRRLYPVRNPATQ